MFAAIQIKLIFEQFWNTIIIPNLAEDKSFLIQFKIQLADKRYRSISKVQSCDIKNYETLLDNFELSWDIKDDTYNQLPVDYIIFVYRLPAAEEKWNLIKINKPIDNQIVNKEHMPINKTKISSYSLPNTMDLKLWGTLVYTHEGNRARIDRPRSKAVYEVIISEDKKVHNINITIGENTVFQFKDTLDYLGSNKSTFKRELNGKVFYYKDGEVILKKIDNKCKFLTKVKGSSHISNKFLTLDIETRTIDTKMIPYCISVFDGEIGISFYLSDFTDAEAMMKEAIYYLMRKKYNQYKVYVHNFSHFEGIFLLNILSSLSDKLKPIIRDGRIIDLPFGFGEGKTKYKLYFRDSYLLLPDSLRKLAINFRVENKGLFPYKFVNNENIPLNYQGRVPSFEAFDGISLQEYEEYCKEFSNKSWDLRVETEKYCELDCIVLYRVIKEFNDKIFTTFRVNILKYPTLSSLAFGIYRYKFLGKAEIPIIDGEMFNFFKEGYTGGAVDVYKPYGEEIYRYDVNSLYPHIMDSTPLPVGNPTYFEGDITLESSGSLTNKPFGIFEVEVTAPDYLNTPILQLRLKTQNGGTRTVAPTGNWTGVYFSEEIYNAMKYGYKFKIIRGYTFKQDYIFSEY